MPEIISDTSCLMSDVQNVSIISLDFEESTLTVDLSDGRTIQLPLEWYPRLLHAPENERNNWRLIGNGEGIHWETLDEDISLLDIIFGRPSGESKSSLQKWLDTRK
jgi:hypothetical protein